MSDLAARLAARLAAGLPEPQRSMAAAMLSGQVSARRGNKATLNRILTRRAALLGEHVHVLGRSGQRCVTFQGIGFLYAKIPRGQRGRIRS